MSSPDLRLAALAKLVDTKSPAVDQRLSEEFGRAERTLRTATDHDELSGALSVLGVLVPRFHMATVPVLENFVRAVPTRALTLEGEPITGAMRRYRSPQSLIEEAIDVLEKLRYVHTEQVVDLLLELTRDSEPEIRTKAGRALEAIASFDLDVFYGNPPRGAEPQARLIAHLAALNDVSLLGASNVVLRVLDTVLSPAMQGASWTYMTVTFRRGSVPGDGGVSAMRAEAIDLAKRMYGLSQAVDHRRRVLQTLDSATRREGRVDDVDAAAMFERNTIAVLEFMRNLVATEALPVVQKIEHQAYWNYYHAASQAIKEKALEVRDAIAAQGEYQIYKQLIGFEGIFGDWEMLRRSDESWEYGDGKRREASRQFVEEIDEATYDTWRDRILEFSRTKSDDMATFPVYYDFLQSIGKERPRLALELVGDHEDIMEPFLIALMRGLWTSVEQVRVQQIADRWIQDGRHLTALAKSLYTVGADRLSVLTAIVDRAVALDDRAALMQAMGVAASLYVEGAADAKAIFMRLLRTLAQHDDAGWASVAWFSRDFRALVGTLNKDELAELLATLVSLPELNYQAVEIVNEVAKHDLQAVLDFFVARLIRAKKLAEQRRAESDVDDDERFEAIPYHLEPLSAALATAPDALLSTLRAAFGHGEDFGYSYPGARLVAAAFPVFGEPLSGALLKYVGTGSDDDTDFVISILRAYDGAAPILEVCKAIIKAAPERSRLWSEVASAIEATGVVVGEFGLSQAYERKRQEIEPWLHDEDERVRAFAAWIGEDLRAQVEQERERAQQGTALRKYRYGVDDDN
eukprot:TRINITY_DN9660_c0_g1_i6.p1 TRINITY_DN9660_c0_g1~~TRINITY_DN9660_c0_g1_i6.p1  ORF type:complete len:907 (+),score=193.30 TRINITY_DN9660_c0_g1_i6:308-2722(+)